jgi:hypothetical protein
VYNNIIYYVGFFAVEHSLTQGGSKILAEARETPKSETPKKLDRLGVLRLLVERETAPIVR